MVEFPDNWDGFFNTLAGVESSTTVTLVNGRPRGFSPVAIPPRKKTDAERKEKSNLEPLAELFRSDVEITRELRNRLADMMSERGSSVFHFTIGRRKSGHPPKALDRYWDFAARVKELHEEHSMTKVRAIRTAKKELGITLSDTAARIEIASYEKALELNDALMFAAGPKRKKKKKN